MKTTNTVSINKSSQEPFPAAYAIWMQKKAKDSEQTARAYSRTFDEFFMFRFGKQTESVTWDDLVQVSNIDFEKFQGQLEDRELEPTTINAYIYHLRWLWKKIAKVHKEIRSEVAMIDPVPDKRDKSNLGADSLDEYEIRLLINYAKTVDFHPEIQALFFEFATVVPLRITALRSITWSSFKKIQGKNGEKLWEVGAWDKGKFHKNPISDDLYQRLQILKKILHNGVGFKDKPDDQVFYISVKKIRDTLDGFKKKYNIDKNLSPHALKKTSARLIYESSGGDVRQLQAHTQHDSAELALQYAAERDRLNSVAINIFADRDRLRQELSGVSRDDLINILTDQRNFSIANAVYQQLPRS